MTYVTVLCATGGRRYVRASLPLPPSTAAIRKNGTNLALISRVYARACGGRAVIDDRSRPCYRNSRAVVCANTAVVRCRVSLEGSTALCGIPIVRYVRGCWPGKKEPTINIGITSFSPQLSGVHAKDNPHPACSKSHR